MSTTATPAETSARDPFIRLHPDDNVLIARRSLALGEHLPHSGATMRAQIPAGHKVAAVDLAPGTPLLKHQIVIGITKRAIKAGEHLHTHNIDYPTELCDPAFGADVIDVAFIPPAQRATFNGYVRADGRVGTRNFIGVLSSVNCSATAIRRIADWFTPERLADYPNIDGVVAFPHTSGCGMSSPSEHFELLKRTLVGYATHRNLAGVVIVGLGCERNQVGDMLAQAGLRDGPLLHSLVMQEEGGTRATIEHGIAAVQAMLPAANACTRTPVSAEHLTVGLQCGGSDGFTGISANPALGAAVDLLVQHGGTAILSETPEIRGVEHLLTRRAVSEAVGRKLLQRLEWWEEYTRGHHGQFNGQVTPGNEQGGLANIFEKSLGSNMKSGTTPLRDVYQYAEPIIEHGLVFMDSPGYDPCATTGQIASGANLICFTTGRGSMFGSKPAPTLKLATNTPMYRRLEEDMDLNCGLILDGEVSTEEMGQLIFESMLRAASGEKTKSELLGLGDLEFVPWHLGIVS